MARQEGDSVPYAKQEYSAVMKVLLNDSSEVSKSLSRTMNPEKAEDTYDTTAMKKFLKALNFNEMVIFLSTGLKLDPDEVADWLDDTPEQ